MTSSQCAWCPWDCPSPEVAACRQPVPEPVPQVLAGVCEPGWIEKRRTGYTKVSKAVDVIRDLADYTPEPQPTAEAVDGS